MIEKLKVRLRLSDSYSLFHDSRSDVRALTEVCKQLIDKVNELTEKVNELEKK